MAADLNKVVDFPKLEINSSGVMFKPRRPKIDVRETEWTRQLMASFPDWMDLVDIKNGRIEREVPLAPKEILSRASQRSLGICRADAIIWHDDNTITIVEAKTSSCTSDICAGIGQLIFYKTLAEVYWGVKVEALILASPFLPPFVLDAIANVKAPIRFLKAEDSLFSGLVPSYA